MTTVSKGRPVGQMNPAGRIAKVPVEQTGVEMGEARKMARLYPFTTSMLPWRPSSALLDVMQSATSYVEAHDAFNECLHGHLPTDTKASRATSGCACWTPDASLSLTEALAEAEEAAHALAGMCKGAKRSGAPCDKTAGPSGYCYSHDPDNAAAIAEKMAKARRRREPVAA